MSKKKSNKKNFDLADELEAEDLAAETPEELTSSVKSGKDDKKKGGQDESDDEASREKPRKKGDWLLLLFYYFDLLTRLVIEFWN